MYKQGLSILIPVFNRNCCALVQELHAQAVNCGIDFEIIVVEDGSTNPKYVDQNRPVAAIDHVRYIIHEKNMGRAIIRNWLADKAEYDTLLFLDCDVDILDPDYLKRYLDNKASVVCGGLCIGGDANKLRHSLRYHYEKTHEKEYTAKQRKRNPYKNFRTTNFLIEHKVMESCRFDERFRQYGYEDVIFGKTLKQNGIIISHIENPVYLTRFESNTYFMTKTEEALHTLYKFRKDIAPYSRLLQHVEVLKKIGLLPVLRLIYRSSIGYYLLRNLNGERPVSQLYNLYKLMFFASLKP